MLEETKRYLEGQQAFDSAQRRAFVENIVFRLRGLPVRLRSFDDVRARAGAFQQIDRGIQEICLHQIIGSVGRHQDFTRTFLPRRMEMRDRWVRIYAETIGALGLPPIELYQVCDLYYVRDGNHRVSVARRLKAHTIQARVVQVLSPQTSCRGTDGQSTDSLACGCL